MSPSKAAAVFPQPVKASTALALPTIRATTRTTEITVITDWGMADGISSSGSMPDALGRSSGGDGMVIDMCNLQLLAPRLIRFPEGANIHTVGAGNGQARLQFPAAIIRSPISRIATLSESGLTTCTAKGKAPILEASQ